MNRGRELVTGITAMAVLAGCVAPAESAPPGPPAPSDCERLGAAVNPNITAPFWATEDLGDYVIQMAVTSVGDNSITGTIVDFVEAKDQEVCERFLDRGTTKPMQIHSNYNTDSWSNSRKQVAMVLDHGQANNFTNM